MFKHLSPCIFLVTLVFWSWRKLALMSGYSSPVEEKWSFLKTLFFISPVVKRKDYIENFLFIWKIRKLINDKFWVVVYGCLPPTWLLIQSALIIESVEKWQNLSIIKTRAKGWKKIWDCMSFFLVEYVIVFAALILFLIN